MTRLFRITRKRVEDTRTINGYQLIWEDCLKRDTIKAEAEEKWREKVNNRDKSSNWHHTYDRETRGRTRSMYITLDYQVESVRPAVCVS